jgi:hypothetical protein
MKPKKALRILFPVLLAILIGSSGIILFSSFNSVRSNNEVRQETNVYICVSKNAVAYHVNQNCRGLNKCTHEIKNVTVDKAKSMGYRACKICSR